MGESLENGSDLDKWLNRLGQYIEHKFGSKDEGGSIAQGFVTGTLIFVIGAMGVLGALIVDFEMIMNY